MIKHLLFITLTCILCGCMPQYQIMQSSTTPEQIKDQDKEGIILRIKEDSVISYKHLAKRTENKDLRLLYFQIENATSTKIVIDYQKIEAISMKDLELVSVLSPDEFYAELENKPFDEIAVGIIGLASMFSFGTVIMFNPISPGWLVAIGAGIQMYRIKKINQQLEIELKNNNIQGDELLPDELKIGIIAVKTKSSEDLILRYSMR